MLTEDQNRRLTRVGRGTPMGELLRRYWMPIAALDELERTPIKPVRLFGEDLVLYQDLAGTLGLVERHCPHRRADLSYGSVDACGIRCGYHGWRFDETGACREQPFALRQAQGDSCHAEPIEAQGDHCHAEPLEAQSDRCHAESEAQGDRCHAELVEAQGDGCHAEPVEARLRAYPVQAKAGLIWAYLGPHPAPLVPTWEPFTWKNGFVQIVFATIPCNWLQCQENSIDPVHFEWMHRNWTVRLGGETGPYGKKHVRIGFDEFEHGFVYKRLMEGMDQSHPRWQTGRICLWPNCLGPLGHAEWRVPIDDENTLSVTWHFSRVPHEREPFSQTSIPSWEGPIRDPRTNRWITSHVMNQDFIAWVGQGTIADRTQEHLASSDRGIILMRKRFLDDIDAIGRGEDPKGLVRDAAQNECITLPIIDRELFTEGLPLAEMVADASLDPRIGYRFQLGQPEHVRRAYHEAMGLDPDDLANEAGAGFLASAGAKTSRRIWT